MSKIKQWVKPIGYGGRPGDWIVFEGTARQSLIDDLLRFGPATAARNGAALAAMAVRDLLRG